MIFSVSPILPKTQYPALFDKKPYYLCLPNIKVNNRESSLFHKIIYPNQGIPTIWDALFFKRQTVDGQRQTVDHKLLAILYPSFTF